jgi:hypothetical protein
MLFQIQEDGEPMGLVQVTKNHTEVSKDRYSEIISNSLQRFKDDGEDDGFDVYDLDDFVTYHNEHSVLIIERVFFEEIEY